MCDEELKAALHEAFTIAIKKMGVDAFRLTSFFLAGRTSATQVAEEV